MVSQYFTAGLLFTDYSPPLVVQSRSLRYVCSLFGFALPAHSPWLRGWSSQTLVLRLSFPVPRAQVRFEEFIEQHRVHRLVTHTVDLTVVIAHHEVGIHVGHAPKDQGNRR